MQASKTSLFVCWWCMVGPWTTWICHVQQIQQNQKAYNFWFLAMLHVLTSMTFDLCRKKQDSSDIHRWIYTLCVKFIPTLHLEYIMLNTTFSDIDLWWPQLTIQVLLLNKVNLYHTLSSSTLCLWKLFCLLRFSLWPVDLKYPLTYEKTLQFL